MSRRAVLKTWGPTDLPVASRRRTDRRLLAPQASFTQEDVEPRADDDRRARNRRHRRHVGEYQIAEDRSPHDHRILERHHDAGGRKFQRAVEAERSKNAEPAG